MIDDDDKIPFWRKVGEKVHEYDCKYIMQLSHSGRQRDIAGVENFMQKALSSTSSKDTFHGLLCEAATVDADQERRRLFANGARRAREAGLRRRRAARLPRLSLHAVLKLGDQRPQGRVRRLAARTAPAFCSR